jgi:hypothetical protein
MYLESILNILPKEPLPLSLTFVKFYLDLLEKILVFHNNQHFLLNHDDFLLFSRTLQTLPTGIHKADLIISLV